MCVRWRFRAGRAGPAVGCAEASELLAAVEASGREGGREGQAACTCASLAGGGSAGSAGVGAAKACDGAAAAAASSCGRGRLRKRERGGSLMLRGRRPLG